MTTFSGNVQTNSGSTTKDAKLKCHEEKEFDQWKVSKLECKTLSTTADNDYDVHMYHCNPASCLIENILA